MARKISNPRVPSWPQQCSPLSTVFDLIKVADEEMRAWTSWAHCHLKQIWWHAAASFCCLMTLWHQHFKGGVDVYQLAKLTHYNRPGVFGTQVRSMTQF